MQRYFIQLSYRGTNFHGWQFQPNSNTVQEVLEKGLSVILREKTEVTGAGRTDTGVHAEFFIAHFDSRRDDLDDPDFTYKLNSYFPPDIAIQRIWKVAPDAHARFDATSRTYKYIVSRTKNPFIIDTAYKYLKPLDMGAMNAAAVTLKNYNDFTSFSKLHSDVKTNNCKIVYAEWKEEGELMVFKIKADRFLRNMVRAIVGTLLEVGKTRISVDEFRKIIEEKDRSAAGASVPAEGLFLCGIEYPERMMGNL